MAITQPIQSKTQDLTNQLIIIFILLAVALFLINRVQFQSLNTLSINQPISLAATNTSSPVSQEDLTVNIVQKSQPSVVTVAEMLPLSGLRQSLSNPLPSQPINPNQSLPQNIGSGFIITSDGYIVTSKHVVSDNQYGYKVLTSDGSEYNVSKIYRDPSNDIALLKIDPNQHPTKNLQPMTLGDSSQIRVGEDVLAIGTALGQFTDTVTHGVVSGVGRGITASDGNFGQSENLQNLIQTSAAINPGNSGGPLINLAGQVIGVNTATSVNGQDIGFAIPSNVVQDFSKNLVQSI